MAISAQLHEARRIAVLRALQLGDLLVAVPALRALRAAAPRAEITLIGLPWAQEFADRFAYLLDGFIPFPGHAALPEREPDIRAWPRFLEEVSARQFDLAIQLHGSGRATNPIVALFGARRIAAFVEPGGWAPDGVTLPYPEGRPEAERLLALMRELGAPADDPTLEFPLRAADHEALLRDAPTLPAGPFVVVHPGARDPRRRWPLASFATVADELAARGLAVVLTGSASETHITAGVAARMRAPALDLAGRTSLGSLAALVSRATLLVSNDTGVAHLAAALRTPSVVIFSASDPARWAPADRLRHEVIDARKGVEPARVVAAALTRLGAEAVHG